MTGRTQHPIRSDRVTMIGLDFGSTTSSAMVATANVGLSSTTGRMEFGALEVVYHSEPIFTPFTGEAIDAGRLEHHLDQWIAESGVDAGDFFAGGVIITGLAAKKANAAALARLIGERIGEAVTAAADDPCLESWLAFMGSCAVLSRFHPETPFINLDIGGGTTNAAYGINGAVLYTGCHFIGARHFQCEPGGYRLTAMSSYGRALLDHLGVDKSVGHELNTLEVDAILDFQVAALEAMARGDAAFFDAPVTRLHQQVPFTIPFAGKAPALVFSGGVGELIYRAARGRELPGTTHYGDLGIDLAKRILRSRLLSTNVTELVPENQGRATVYGLALHSTEISGSTVFLSSRDVLPRRDLPIVARLSLDADVEWIRRALALATPCANGACIQVSSRGPDPASGAGDQGTPGVESIAAVKIFGRRLLEARAEMKQQPLLVLLVPQNYGQTLGNYASNWRRETSDLVVIDEIPDRQAHFVNIGRLRNNIAPISFYGIC